MSTMPLPRPVASPRRATIPRSLGAAFAAALLSPGSLLVAMIAMSDAPRGSTIAAWSAVSLVVVVPVVWALARFALANEGGEGAGLVAAFTLLGVLPTVFFGSIWSWGIPIVRAGWDFCGTGDVSLVMLGLPLTALFAGLATLAAFPLADRWRRDGRGPLLGPVVGGAAFFATLALGAFVLTLAPRLDRPAADAWTSTLPVVARIPAAGPPGFVGTITTPLDERVSLERNCTMEDAALEDRSYCQLRLILSIGEVAMEGGPHASNVGPEVELAVSRDAAHDIWLVSGGEWASLRAFHGLEPGAIETLDVADVIAPPGPAVLAGLVGALLALGLLLLRSGMAWRARAIRAGREGRADGHGIAFDDGELPARGGLALDVPEGPVVALRARTGHAHYRDDGTRSAWRVVSGNRATLLEGLGARILACDALALAIALTALTPLLVVSRTLLGP